MKFGRNSKVVHFWRMEANGEQVHDLMHDVKAVDWLPLDQAVERLSRGYERAFLANVGPLALQTAAAGSTPSAALRPEFPDRGSARTARGRKTLIGRVRDWLRRAT